MLSELPSWATAPLMAFAVLMEEASCTELPAMAPLRLAVVVALAIAWEFMAWPVACWKAVMFSTSPTSEYASRLRPSVSVRSDPVIATAPSTLVIDGSGWHPFSTLGSPPYPMGQGEQVYCVADTTLQMLRESQGLPEHESAAWTAAACSTISSVPKHRPADSPNICLLEIFF